jgi:hypothetical protein
MTPPSSKAMMLSFSRNDRAITIVLPSDSTSHEFLEGCRLLALGATYPQAAWDAAIAQAADELLINESNNDNLR